jgi:hypothetical protein
MFLIYRTDDNGRPYLHHPIGKVELTFEEDDDDYFDLMKKAVNKFVELNPHEKGNKGWLTSQVWTKKQIEEQIEEQSNILEMWKSFLK